MADNERAGMQPAQPFSAGELLAISEELTSHFPQPFMTTELVLMVVDPHHVHAYWHVRIDDIERARAQVGPDANSAPLVLRFYDVTMIDFSRQPAHSYFDVAVHGLQSNWYVEMWADGRSYVADLGLRRGDGALSPLARSSAVHTPPTGQGAYYDRTALVLEPGGGAREVPDLTAVPPQPWPPSPTPSAPPDEVARMVREFYRRLTASGLPDAPSTGGHV